MQNMKKFYSFIAISYLVALVVFATLTHLGLLDIKLYDKLEIGNSLNNIIKFCFYSINIYFLLMIISRNRYDKNIKYYVGYTAITIPIYLINTKYTFILTFLLPILFLFIMSILKIDNIPIKQIITRFLMFLLITTLVQFLIFFVRFGQFDILNMQDLNVKHYFIVSIDLLIYYYIYYKVVTADVKSFFPVFNFLHAKNKCISKTCNDFQKVLDLQSLKMRQRAVFYLLAYGYQFITLFVVLAIGQLNNKLIELIVMLLIFWIGRKILCKSWHSDDLWKCSTITFVSFYILTLVPFVSFEISLLAGISLSAMFVFILYKLAEFEENYGKLKDIYNRFYSFDLMKCTENEILERCKIVGMSKDDTSIVLDIFYHQIPIKELSKKLHMTTNSLRNKKTKLKKRLLVI